MSLPKPLLASAVGLACLTLVPRAAHAQIEAQLITSGVTSGTALCSPPGDTERVFVTSQTVTVRLIKNDVLQATPFLDITAIVQAGGERGLLGLAFHPDYANNGKFYVSYTQSAAPNGGSVVRQYLRDATNHDVADPASFQVIFGPLAQPFSNHNGGWIGFSPIDGKLYFSLGDGGSGNDPGNRAQNPQNLLGKMLRFDVDVPFPHVPADNPFVGDPSTLDLIWALGLRNPWRCGFDRMTGDLWIGDVGQSAREEVNFEPAGAGGRNYGWRCMEGLNCTGLTGCTCNSPALTLPVHQYNTGTQGCSVIGGYRFRGGLMPNHVGRYFFGDYCSGRIWSFAFDGTSISNLIDHTTSPTLQTMGGIAAFGEDASGELYIVQQSGGRVWRLREPCNGATNNFCVTSPNSNGSGAVILAAGSTDVSSNNFHLTALGASSSQPGIFFYGDTEVQVPFGDGFRCVGGAALYRLLPPVVTDGFGDVTRHVDFTLPPADSGGGAILPGSTWKFQFWFRDPAFGGTGFNLSNGLSANFCP